MHTLLTLLALASVPAQAADDAAACNAKPNCGWAFNHCWCKLEPATCPPLEPIPNPDPGGCLQPAVGGISPPGAGTCSDGTQSLDYVGPSLTTLAGEQVVVDGLDLLVCDLRPVRRDPSWGKSMPSVQAQRDFAVDQLDQLLPQVERARAGIVELSTDNALLAHELTHVIQQSKRQAEQLAATTAALAASEAKRRAAEKEVEALRAKLADVYATCEDTCVVGKDGQVLCGSTDHF